MIYSSGTATGNFQSFSYGNDVGVIGTGGKTKTQTLLAQQVVPPFQPTDYRWFVIVVLMLVFLLISFVLSAVIESVSFILKPLGYFIGMGLGTFVCIIVWPKISKSYHQEFDNWRKSIIAWENSWMCLKCGWQWNMVEHQQRLIQAKNQGQFDAHPKTPFRRVVLNKRGDE